MSFGAHLRSLRQARGLTQEELAERAGMTSNGVSALERGTRTRPYPHTVRMLAQALNLDEGERHSFLAAAREEIGADPPPPRVRSRLPVSPTPLIGRNAELDELAKLLADPAARLITLTGPGGVGKTRLATEAARRSEAAYPDRVVLVPLASVPDPDLVVPTILGSLLGGQASGLSGEELADVIGSRKILLVLDNFEHLMQAAPVLSDLLSDCAALTILVTSRARLRLRGEVELAVPPLALPRSTRAPSLDEVSESAAGRLFLERAHAAQPDFALSEDNAASIASITWRLGGLPLAIECVAAKVRSFPPREMLENLDQAIATGWARDLPERQRSLRAVLDWSYRLLDESAQTALRWLSVFQGGATLAAAEIVLGPALGREQMISSLEELTEHSLLTPARDGLGGVRYTMLQPILEYARDLLRERGEEGAAAREHARWTLGLLAEEAAGPREAVDWETENVRAAFDWSVAQGDGELATRLAVAAWTPWLPWWMGAPAAHGRERMEAVLGLELTGPTRAQALLVHGGMCYAQGDVSAAEASWQEALQTAREEENAPLEAYALAGTGLAKVPSDPEEGARRLRRATELAATSTNKRLRFMSRIWAGMAAGAAGEPAQPAFEDVLRSARRSGDRTTVSAALFNLANAALEDGHDEDAEPALLESIELAADDHENLNVAHALDLLAVLESRRGNWRRAAMLLGAADGMRSTALAVDASYHQPDPSLRERAGAAAESALGGEDYAEALSAGSRLNLDDVKQLVGRA